MVQRVLFNLKRVEKNIDKKTLESATFKSISNGDNSLIRWGDGEYQLLLYRSIHFQEKSIILSFLLFILFIVSLVSAKITFAYPSKTIIKAYGLNTRPWRVSKILSKFIPDSSFSPFIFRKEGNINSDISLDLIRRCSDKIYLGKKIKGVDMIFEKCIFIPDTNSFEFLLKRLKSTITELKCNDVIFLSAGPGGKIIGVIMIICFRKKVIDFGHGIDKLLDI